MRSRLWGLLVGAAWLFAGAMLAGLVFVGSFYLAMRRELRSTEVRVPDLAGLTLDDARARAQPDGLALQVADERNDPSVPSGRVIGQTPPAGSSVRRGRKVKLVLSLGGRMLSVPEIVAQPSRAVAIELSRGGFVAGDEATVYSTEVPAGIVLAQVPPPGTPAVPSTRVHRLVSRGPPEPVWVMPDLTGLDREQVERWLALCSFRRGALRRVAAAGRRPGTVVGQLPLAGYPVAARDVVELSVAE